MLFKFEAICSQAFSLSILLTLWTYGSVTKSSLQAKVGSTKDNTSQKITLKASGVNLGNFRNESLHKRFTRNGNINTQGTLKYM